MDNSTGEIIGKFNMAAVFNDINNKILREISNGSDIYTCITDSPFDHIDINNNRDMVEMPRDKIKDLLNNSKL